MPSLPSCKLNRTVLRRANHRSNGSNHRVSGCFQPLAPFPQQGNGNARQPTLARTMRRCAMSRTESPEPTSVGVQGNGRSTSVRAWRTMRSTSIPSRTCRQGNGTLHGASIQGNGNRALPSHLCQRKTVRQRHARRTVEPSASRQRGQGTDQFYTGCLAPCPI